MTGCGWTWGHNEGNGEEHGDVMGCGRVGKAVCGVVACCAAENEMIMCVYVYMWNAWNARSAIDIAL